MAVAYTQDVVMLFGDSITQGGWAPELNGQGVGQRLSHVYARRLDVLNRGLSGYCTDWAIPVFKKNLVPTHNRTESTPTIRLLLIWFGANDSCLPSSPQHVPLPKFAANIKECVDVLHSPESTYYSPQTRIILLSPPPVNTEQRRANLAARTPPLELDRDFETTRLYAEAVKVVAVERGVGFVDVWGLLWRAAGEDEEGVRRFLEDGLHLNGEGYKIVYEALMETIKEKYPDVHPDNVPFVSPPWLSLIPESMRFKPV